MRRRTGAVRPPKEERPATPGSRRDRLAMRLALATIVCLGVAFLLSKGTTALMPGPLTSDHGAIENCSACHTKSGSGKLSWIHGLVSGDPRADSKACLTCHKMPDTAFNAHGASAKVLEESTERLLKIAARSPAPQSARAQAIAFPTHDLVARGLYCATCHQEHQGVHANLNKISNEQCRSCHVVKFDSFDGRHPKFDNYPFKRRTRIIYDHAGHFGKHFPEVAKKHPARRIPDTCSTCHNSHKDRRVMAVAPFEQTCTGCHLDQIVGKERASGPKGIAFLTLPGLDLQTLKGKGAAIGEWPEGSEAELTPFMKVMISQDQRGRALIKTVDKLNLQDLTGASDDQIKAVTSLVWEIKVLFYALISGKASDVLADLNVGGGAKPSADLLADLTASLPRDVVISAQQEWLPNLATEMAKGPDTSGPDQSGWSAVIAEDESAAPEESDQDADDEAARADAEDSEVPRKAKLDPPVCTASILGQCLVFKKAADGAGAAKTEAAKAEAAGSEEADESEDAGEENDTVGESDEAASADEAPEADADAPANAPVEQDTASAEDAENADESEAAAEETDTANATPDGGKATTAADDRPPPRAADQTDDLLSPTEEERRVIEAHAEKAAGRGGAGGDAPADLEVAEGLTGLAPTNNIQSDVDPESWAEYGGWYRQDYAIFYRPTGHKDKFVYSWLSLTGPQAPKGDESPAAAVFDFLTGKDAQGSCTKCHSVDAVAGKGRVVNFSPPSAESKQGRFTNFIHEPHFQAVGIGQRVGILENHGCLTCHSLEKGRPYLKSYEQGNPQKSHSNFGEMKKNLCQTCHNVSTARQDCLLCHKYHVNGVVTPIMNTKIPNQ